MTRASQVRLQITLPIVLMSAGAWLLLALTPMRVTPVSHCSSDLSGAGFSGASPGVLSLLKAYASFSAGWAVMLIAMMAPLLIAPMRHISDRSLARRRMRAILLFGASYAGVWTAAGLILTMLAQQFRRSAPASRFFVPCGIVLALLWQFSPAKQRCLNRVHVHPDLTAFGWTADATALRFGLMHGFWCCGSCWTLMLLPLLVSRGHVVVMAVVTLWLWAEQLESPMPSRWCWRAPRKAARIAAFWTEILLSSAIQGQAQTTSWRISR
jgi:predicted metal-binding membrane protein